MRLAVNKSKYTTSIYVIKSVFENGVSRTKVVEKLGTLEKIAARSGGQDPLVWAKQYVAELTLKEKQKNQKVVIELSPTKVISCADRRLFNGGYFFLQRLYYDLGLDVICNEISNKYSLDYDLNSILSRLIYARIIYPESKLSAYEESQKFIEPPKFQFHDVYQSLDVIAKEADYIQSALYKNSQKCHAHNSRILFYDSTNFFFEIDEEIELNQYKISKEHSPNPVAQLGLFTDGAGIPLAFCINPENTNECATLNSLEKKLIKDFGLSKLVVCTDVALASTTNSVFNNFDDKAFITKQSIKQLKGVFRQWALDENGWNIFNNHDIYNLSAINECAHKETIFYKERWINENGLEQRLIVMFSVNTKNYQRKIREGQINRALKLIENNPKTFESSQNDYKRLISTMNLTTTGEVTENTIFSINEELIKEESMYDGYYAICTNLVDSVSEIAKINRGRWEIEESFRIMKTDFKMRSVHLSKNESIEAHFTTCFIALLISRLLEKKLDSKYTSREIIDTLRELNFIKEKGECYIPGFIPTEITNDIHERFGFRLDYEILVLSYIKKLQKLTK
ncbi:MAG: IS1634 family transposase [Christensenellaceae bacterium]|jgi:hypothetical protein|nr:IS1634 family transposase [Christensenellaceae bacterium]